MLFGAAMFVTDYSMRPAALARALEERGFESFWAPEHSHIPVDRASPWPQGGPLPEKYVDVADPFVVLSMAAAATERLKVATGICLAAQRDPIQLAKETASLDALSEGRFLFGVGGGWNREEMADHGTAFEERFSVLRERIAAIRAIWNEEEAAFSGRHLSFAPMRSRPKPAQPGGPPVLVGGEFPHGARRALAWGDGWVPHAERPTYRLLDRLPEFRAMEAEAGRSVPVTVFGAEDDPARLDAWREAGIERVVFNLPSAGADEVLPLLDRWAGRL